LHGKSTLNEVGTIFIIILHVHMLTKMLRAAVERTKLSPGLRKRYSLQ
jgi:hypothetical protein